jgi:hypothetical protein
VPLRALAVVAERLAALVAQVRQRPRLPPPSALLRLLCHFALACR